MLGDKTIDNNTETANRDPLSGAPGAHPVGVGIGAAAGGMAAGAAAGTVAGPVGTLVGAAVGAVVGGLAGKGVAESIDPTAEDAYWRENYASRDYVAEGRSYDDYGPAYGYGVGRFDRDRSFEDVEPELADGWMGARGASSLGWGEASLAARDAWERLGGRAQQPL
jgi:hypothetical protein